MKNNFLLVVLTALVVVSCSRGASSNPLTDMLLLDYMTGGSILGIGSGTGSGTGGGTGTGTTGIDMVSVDSNGVPGKSASDYPSISGDGRYVAFHSFATNLVSGDTNLAEDVFVHDRQTGVTSRVSISSSGVQGDISAYTPFPLAISSSGHFVAFGSASTNLVAGDTNGVVDVFVHDRQTGVTNRVSVDSGGVQGNGISGYTLSISADGRYIAFESDATNLVTGDTNGQPDVFVHDQQTGVTSRVSVDSTGAQGNLALGEAFISDDGRYVAFSTSSILVIGDTNGTADVYMHDRQTGVTSLLSVDSADAQGNSGSHHPSMSSGGRYVAFESSATNLVVGDTNALNDIFVHDRQTGTTSRVSVDSTGTQGNRSSYNSSISADGRYIAFQSLSTNLVAGDTNGKADIFVHDRQTGTTVRVSAISTSVQADRLSDLPSISADGRYVAFGSSASNFVTGDIYGVHDVFVAQVW